jgi:hypothetical protein
MPEHHPEQRYRNFGGTLFLILTFRCTRASRRLNGWFDRAKIQPTSAALISTSDEGLR